VPDQVYRNRVRRLLERLREARQMIAQLLKERKQYRSGEGGPKDPSIEQRAAVLDQQAEALMQRQAALAAKRKELHEARGSKAAECDQPDRRRNAEED
jgi:hypothetical protein